MTPRDLLRCNPVHVGVLSLHAHHGVYAFSAGILRPRVLVDRKAETMPGFEALVWHESLHAVEWHALLGIVFLLLGAIEFAVAVTFEIPVAAVTGPLAALAAWVWWKREQEIRADAIALYGAGLGGLHAADPRMTDESFRQRRMRQGLADFRSFLRLHVNGAADPRLSWAARAWERWKYGPTIAHRELRAVRRCRRLGWPVREAAERD